jgi:hypothetical protein
MVAVAVAAAVVLDLPHPASTSERTTDLESVLAEMRTDIGSCNVNVQEVLRAYAAVVAGDHRDRGEAERIAQQNEPLCTPAGNGDLYDLGTLDIPSDVVPLGVQRMATDLDRWAFPEAAQAILDVEALLHGRGGLADLRSRCAAMHRYAAEATSALAADDRRLRTRVAGFGLVDCAGGRYGTDD